MCTILTVDRNFYENNRAEFDHRTKMDASINRDGFAITMLGDTDEEVITVQMMDYHTAMEFIHTNKIWKRLFLHTRAATTKHVNIFSCHNFKTSGNGVNNGKDNWIIQHNGYVNFKEASGYLVDSMYIADLVNETGIDMAIEKIIKEQSYSNIFFINPENGEYRVVRCVVNTLYTDNLGNYSTKIMGSINIPAKMSNSTTHKHKMSKKVTFHSNWRFSSNSRFDYRKTFSTVSDALSKNEQYGRITEKEEDFWDEYVMKSLKDKDKLNYQEDPADEYDRKTGRGNYSSYDEDEYSSSEQEMINEIINDEIAAFGEEAVVFQDDKDCFIATCKKLKFGFTKKMPNNFYSQLSQEQKRWFKHMKPLKLG